MHARIDTWEKLVAYFWKFTQKSDGCWNFTGPKDKHGYGRIHPSYASIEWKISSIRTHRLSWIIHHGHIPEELDVLHDCDNTSCVNPKHLHLGTQADNNREMIERGRLVSSPGEKNGFSKLKEREVKTILKLKGGCLKEIAAMFSVSTDTIRLIYKGKRWAHVPR